MEGISYKSLTLKKEYIEQIREGSKTVEGRIFERAIKKLKEGDIVRFYYYSNAKDDVFCQITRIDRFQTFAHMLTAIEFQKCLPKLPSKELALKAYLKIPKYPEKEKLHGVAAIHLSLFKA